MGWAWAGLGMCSGWARAGHGLVLCWVWVQARRGLGSAGFRLGSGWDQSRLGLGWAQTGLELYSGWAWAVIPATFKGLYENTQKPEMGI